MTISTPTARLLDESATGEVVRGYLAVGACLFVLGFVAQGALQQLLPAGSAVGGSVDVTGSLPDLLHILRSNVGFFIMVSLLPVLNSVVVGQQLFTLGATAHQIHQLPLATQFDLLYRHTALEMIALFMAVRISYVFFFTIREYLRSDGSSKATLAARLKSTIPLYLVVVLCTVVGALLEGTANVHV